MPLYRTKRLMLAVLLTLLVGATPATLGAFWGGHGLQNDCCQAPCNMPAVPSHPIAPANCCMLACPDPSEAVQPRRDSQSVETLQPSASIPGFAAMTHFNLSAQRISALDAARRNVRARADYSALFCTFLI